MKTAIIELLKVKSIITLAIIGAMVYMACREMIEPATFMTIAGSVVTYYFTKDSGQAERKGKQADEHYAEKIT